MDITSIVSALLSPQTGNVQSQIDTSILNANAKAEKSTVLTLLGVQTTPSTANLGPGVGGSLDITA